MRTFLPSIRNINLILFYDSYATSSRYFLRKCALVSCLNFFKMCVSLNAFWINFNTVVHMAYTNTLCKEKNSKLGNQNFKTMCRCFSFAQNRKYCVQLWISWSRYKYLYFTISKSRESLVWNKVNKTHMSPLCHRRTQYKLDKKWCECTSEGTTTLSFHIHYLQCHYINYN